MEEYVYCINNVNILKYNKHGIHDVIVVIGDPKPFIHKKQMFYIWHLSF